MQVTLTFRLIYKGGSMDSRSCAPSHVNVQCANVTMPRPEQQPAGLLPKERVNPESIFTQVCVDYDGQLLRN